MRKVGLVTTVAFCLASSGCATLFASGPDRVQVASNPPGAKVFVDGTEVGVTPLVVTLDRGHSQGNIKVEAAGYQTAALQRPKAFNPVALLNCLGLLGWVIDLATGNVNEFDTTPVNISLQPTTAMAPGAPAVITPAVPVAPVVAPAAAPDAPPAVAPIPPASAPAQPGQ